MKTIYINHLSHTFLFAACLFSAGANAQNAIDHRLPLDRSGIYRAQDAVPLALGLVAITGALYEGSESRLGKNFWQSSEALVTSEVLAQTVKLLVRRQSPKTSDNPNNWFKNSGDDSFPSGHVTLTAAAVTPFILEYKEDHPWVMALAILPAYEMVARVKARQHWQTDVLAGAALGTAVGWVEHGRKQPWVISILPQGVFVGYHQKL